MAFVRNNNYFHSVLCHCSYRSPPLCHHSRYYAYPDQRIQMMQNVALVFRFLTDVEKLQLGDNSTLYAYHTVYYMHTTQYTIYIPHSILYTYHTVYYIHTTQYTIYIQHSILYTYHTVYYIHTTQYTIYIPHSILYTYHTVYYIHTTQYTIYIPHI